MTIIKKVFPETQTYIPAEEPENAQNPRPNFAPFVKRVTDHWFTPELDACRNCFVCRVPEIRLIWFFAAQTYMLTSFTNVYKFAGNVSQSCMNNQTGYIELCGPRRRGGALPLARGARPRSGRAARSATARSTRASRTRTRRR